MFESMLRQEIGFHDQDSNRPSILATQLALNAQFCKGLTSDKIGVLCQGFSGLGLGLCVSFAINWKLTLVLFIFVPIVFFSGVFTIRFTAGDVKVGGKYAVEEGGRILIETVENVRTVVSLGEIRDFILLF